MSRLVKPKAPVPTVVPRSWCPARISQAEDVKLCRQGVQPCRLWVGETLGESWRKINQTLLPC